MLEKLATRNIQNNFSYFSLLEKISLNIQVAEIGRIFLECSFGLDSGDTGPYTEIRSSVCKGVVVEWKKHEIMPPHMVTSPLMGYEKKCESYWPSEQIGFDWDASSVELAI